MDKANENKWQELLYVMGQRNLVYNHDFLYFSNVVDLENKQYGIPDGWLYEDTGNGGEINLEGTSCKIVTGKGDKVKMSFKQALHEFPRWESQLKGKTITARAEIKLLYEAEISLTLTDGIDSSIRTKQLSGDVELDVQMVVGSEATGLFLVIESASPAATIYIKKVYANAGAIALENLPCMVQGVIGERKQYCATKFPPPEEISLCDGGFQLDSSYTRLNSVIAKRFGTSVDGKYSLLPDMRGYFSRSWNNGCDRDPDASTRVTPGNKERTGDLPGTVEEDAFKEHDHSIEISIAGNLKPDGTIAVMGNNGSIQSLKTGGRETRPKNFAELYTIKWA